jgi:hypothetical protein
MADYLKIIQVGAEILNQVQDNVQNALPDRSDLTDGFLVENASVSNGATVNHGLGRQALGAIVVAQTNGVYPILITGLSPTTLTISSDANLDGTASFWVF